MAEPQEKFETDTEMGCDDSLPPRITPEQRDTIVSSVLDTGEQKPDVIALTSEEMQALQGSIANLREVEKIAQRELSVAQNAYTAQLYLIAQNKGVDLGSYTFNLQARGWVKK